MQHPKLADCESGKESPYNDSEIEEVNAFRSIDGWSLAELAVSRCMLEDERGDPLGMEWFVVSPTGEVSYLDSSMWLVDVGDFDSDGKSELIFSIDDYNRGGYKLFYGGFSKKAVFEFSYH